MQYCRSLTIGSEIEVTHEVVAHNPTSNYCGLDPLRISVVIVVPRKDMLSVSQHIKGTRITKYDQRKDTVHSTSE